MNNYFDHIFCINLARRQDRKTQAIAEFAKHNIIVEFVDAVDGKELQVDDMLSIDGTKVSAGDIGCVLSHLKLAQLAQTRGYKNYFVFEDDAELDELFYLKLQTFMLQLPQNWDLFYLGGQDKPEYADITPIDTHIVRTGCTFCTHAFAVKHTMYDALIKQWSKKNEKVDIALSLLLPRFFCYSAVPKMVYQRQSFSDILNTNVDYKHLR